MISLSKNDGIVLAPNQLPPPQLVASNPGLIQYVENGQLNQEIYLATRIPQNNSGVAEMLKGNLKAQGITEIVTGIITMLVGTIQIISSSNPYGADYSIIAGTPCWTGVVFIIAGSLAVAVEKTPTHSMINGCLSMNIISAIFCLPAIIMYSINIAIAPYCYDCGQYETVQVGSVGTIVCLAILLVLSLLNTAISIAISSFNCKAASCCNKTPVPIIVVYNNPSAQLNPSVQLNGAPPPYNMTSVANVYAE
ncbi:membrane-spanning 4-domains subfamily A member 4D-like [Heptranchias perlo]|uniref:membrane-spanning 4-domains subfamily A member 4D-like n=1 Tax=Heptranchias perlo TaxID=212740 RepID=UPI003559E371